MKSLEILDAQYFNQQYRVAHPSPGLDEIVDFYFSLDLRKEYLRDCVFEENMFPNFNSSIIFNLGSAYSILNNTCEISIAGNSDYILGPSSYIRYKHFGNNYSFGIKFKPAALNHLLNIDDNTLYGGPINLEYIIKTRVNEMLQEALDFVGQVAIAEKFLRCLLKGCRFSYKTSVIINAFQKHILLASRYNVSTLSRELCIGKKTFERYCEQILGTSPKQILLVTRFRSALQVYQTHGNSADFEELGYEDLSHFRKEYRKFISGIEF